jgi:hypothetical protein
MLKFCNKYTVIKMCRFTTDGKYSKFKNKNQGGWSDIKHLKAKGYSPKVLTVAIL